jgi:DNA-binding SARP family transcriptional activator
LSLGHERHGRVAVGPGLAGSMLPASPLGPLAWLGLGPLNPMPVQETKVHRPLLRPDTLSRERLTGWLEEAARHRVAVVIGESGFGKTTLLADWSSTTARRTSWYRLEPDDRDWLTLLRHLIAGGRELDPQFGSDTYRMIGMLGPGGPTQDDVVQRLGEEMASFGAGDARGFSVIMDDYQVLDGNRETDPIITSLIEHTGPGFSLVLAARTPPRLPTGRVRSRSAIIRMDPDALRFDLPETGRLFRDVFGIPMEPDVLRDLVARTEGWAALLSLVRANLDERPDPDPRALVAQLSATRGDLYDYLAEEVLADLPDDIRAFLNRVAILVAVDVPSAVLVTSEGATEVAISISRAEQLGLLNRPDRGDPHRFHPLVRAFLVGRLEEEIGKAPVRALHSKVARALEQSDWQSAAFHYKAAGEPESAARVVDHEIPAILAAGLFDRAIPLLDGTAGPLERAGALILRSRVEFVRGNWQRAITLAEGAVSADDPALNGTALLNLSSLEAVAGFGDGSIERATAALDADLADSERSVAIASGLVREAQREGNLADIADSFRALATQQELDGHSRYAAITSLNLAAMLLWLGDPREALRCAVRAEVAFEASPSSVERVSAQAARATALMQLSCRDEAERVMRAAETAPSVLARDEAAIEIARIHCDYGSLPRAEESIQRLDPKTLPAGYAGAWAATSGALALRRGQLDAAERHWARASRFGYQDVAGVLRTQMLRARISITTDRSTVHGDIAELARIAGVQGSRPGQLIADLLAAIAGDAEISTPITSLGPDERHVLSVCAEELSRVLQRLTPAALSHVSRQASERPDRWRTALGLAVQHPGAGRLAAATLLAKIGDEADASLLGDVAATAKALRPAAASIIHRLSPRVTIADLGVVRLEVGGRTIGRPVRRKALGLLCFVASRPNQAATRDEALDALWTDIDPDAGANSLHQAIYFLRRVFDPEFREGISAPYVTFDGEVITLNEELIGSRSRECWRLLTESAAADVAATDQLMLLYEGRFALDFSYEEWASSYRETLHAAVLSRVEAALGAAIEGGDLDRSVRIAQRALVIDPTADAIELALLRTYKASGRLAAAAEQYAHYASTLRADLGIEPPPLDAL